MRLTDTQFNRLGQLAREVVEHDRALEEARGQFFEAISSHDGKVLSLGKARTIGWPVPTAWRGHLSRALAKVCNNGRNQPEGGPPNAGAMAA
jgi:hypothetical protein